MDPNPEQRPRVFKACFWPQILLKNKFWNLGENTIPKNSNISPRLKTRTSCSFIPQALPWQCAGESQIEHILHFFDHF